MQDGLVTVDAPRSQALIGFVRDRGKAVSNLAADVTNSFCTILLSSMDEKPIANSSRLLLVAGGPVENTGQAWNTAGTDVTAWGESPTRIEQVKGTITLRRIKGASTVTIQPIDGAGQPLGPAVKGIPNGDDWSLPIGDKITTWYEITITR